MSANTAGRRGSRRRVHIPRELLESLASRYEAGETVRGLAAVAGCSEDTLARRLTQEMGLRIRSGIEIAREAARRCGPMPYENKVRAARRRMGSPPPPSVNERALMEVLDAHAVSFVREWALGPYNVDFCLPELGWYVEVRGGGNDASTRATREHKLRSFLLTGLPVLEVFVRAGGRHVPITPGLMRVLHDKPDKAEHVMVYGDGREYRARTSRVCL